ncbi:cytidylate kinase [Erythrobacter longus]|uniref:Cytidylate kinase n=1 Tax=Erythrobacter longus TaxID=1044 RepID=A0A074ME08_ERYLO|nr:d(CMP) kinase [Erythrobacter longus]KEO91694.1 cytidylate kinase [Erythrobacter longus]
MIIAVDGPTASGKGTIAKRLAAHFGVPCLDTGLLYRAVGRQVAINEGDPDNPAEALAACAFPDELLDDEVLRTEESGGLASRVSVHPEVREALFKRQRAFAEQPGGAVLDGRDIGTVIAPDADVKLFITASVQSRARRRWMEMVDKKLDHEEEIPLSEIEKDVVARDARDINRKDAPLKAAPDAFVIDTTSLDREQAFEMVLETVEEALKNR